MRPASRGKATNVIPFGIRKKIFIFWAKQLLDLVEHLCHSIIGEAR